MTKVVISGTGLFTPSEAISNEELVACLNAYVSRYNEEHKAEIDAGEMEPLQESSSGFIEKVSGIKSRFVLNKSGILDVNRMKPDLPDRSNDEQSIQCEMGVAAAQEAMDRAGKTAADIDAVIVACSNLQRAYPAVAVEMQAALGIEGYAFDMNVACSSATFGIQTAVDAIRNGSAKTVLMINPEICTAHMDFHDRDSHFIFGDVCTAVIIESVDQATSPNQFEIVATKLKTQFSNNIRNNFGFLNNADDSGIGTRDKLFVQNGRKVFKEVVPMVSDLIVAQLEETGLSSNELKRLWLHQANSNMNLLIGKKVLGREATEEETPLVLDEYANTSSAGSIIAFHKHQEGMSVGDLGVVCSFGAGYSAGCIILRKVN